MPRVALAGMILESNRFARPAEKDDFTRLVWSEGDALLTEARRETPALAAEFAAFVRSMDATGPWEPVPCLLAASRPAGPVRKAVFEEVAETTLAALRRAGPVDAVYLCHHGAMVAEHLHDPDGELAQRVRGAVGAEGPVQQGFDQGKIMRPLRPYLIGHGRLGPDRVFGKRLKGSRIAAASSSSPVLWLYCHASWLSKRHMGRPS